MPHCRSVSKNWNLPLCEPQLLVRLARTRRLLLRPKIIRHRINQQDLTWLIQSFLSHSWVNLMQTMRGHLRPEGEGVAAVLHFNLGVVVLLLSFFRLIRLLLYNRHPQQQPHRSTLIIWLLRLENSQMSLRI
jgi:hypothetical protein